MAVDSGTRATGRRHAGLLVAAAGAALALVVVHLVQPTGPVGDGTYLAAVVAAAVVAWVGTGRAPREHRLVPALIAAGLSVSAVGDVIWLAISWSGDEPAVSVADVPYLASYLGLERRSS